MLPMPVKIYLAENCSFIVGTGLREKITELVSFEKRLTVQAKTSF